MRRLRNVSSRPFLPAKCANVQLSVTVLAVGGEVLADGDSLLDEHVEVLWDLGGEA